jgi:hypothetical protein
MKTMLSSEHGADTGGRGGELLCGEMAAGCAVTDEGDVLCNVGVSTSLLKHQKNSGNVLTNLDSLTIHKLFLITL